MVRAVWRARLDEHLGFYVVEGLRLRAGTLLGLRHGAYGLTHLAGLVRLLPERDPHADLFATLHALLDDFDEAKRAAIAALNASGSNTSAGFRSKRLNLWAM